MSFGVRDIRNLYPRISENHLRYLEKWGLIRAASTRAGGEFTFSEVATIKQLATELERAAPPKPARRSRWPEPRGQLHLPSPPRAPPPAKVVALQGRHNSRKPAEP